VTTAATQKTRQAVAAIAQMTLAELRKEWERRYGAAPRHRSADLVRRVLAWRVQADALGGLDATTLKLVDSRRAPQPTKPQSGQRLAREYAGHVHEVVVLEDHVLYKEQRYASLSEVARQITGKRWNSPRFFGLRDKVRP
jgi:Protein of unknown function (DUF2924)